MEATGMTLLVYALLPALMLLVYGGLLSTYIHLAYAPDRKIETGASHTGMVTLAVYAVWMVLITIHQGQVPIANGGQMAAFLGFLIWADQSYVQFRIRQRMLTLLPIAAVVLLILLAIVTGVRSETMPKAALGWWMAFHVTLALASAAMLMGAGVYAAGYLMLHKQIKQHRFGQMFAKLPSMEEINRLRAVALYVGWGLITVSFGSSAIWMAMNRSPEKVVISHLSEMSILWLVLSAIAILEKRRVLSQRKLAAITVAFAGFMFILILWTMIAMYTRTAS
jgi:HemX protein